MKNYYKILQVDKDASPEIIKVAYKLLVKKNHPDLKEGAEKQIAEEKIKEINEAYDILSNPEEKAKYDQNLINEFISQEQYNTILNENINLKKELNYFNNLYNKNNYAKRQYSNMYDHSWEKNYTQPNSQNNYNANHNNAQNSYNNQHTNYNNINKNNFKFNLSEKLKTFIAVTLTFLIIFIILNIPFIKEYLLNFLGSSYLIFFIAIIAFYIYFFRNKQ
ncbi:MAG: J domain-containing protein [Clostridia bacterium]|nr:J domain-containing protein [Clostridia bacterium]